MPWSVREPFWRALGVDVDTMKLFQDANPRWDPHTQTLFVSADLRGDDKVFDKVEAFLLYAHSWINFSDGRFGGIGPCGRRCMVSLACGLDSLFKYCEDVGALSNYYSNPYHILPQG